ncbi:hypothetical protein AAY473_023348, partial [Plecturocebus cupreus]
MNKDKNDNKPFQKLCKTEKKTGGKFYDIIFGNDVLDMTPKSWTTKEKNRQIKQSKFKTFKRHYGYTTMKNTENGPSAVAHTCNPSNVGEGGRRTEYCSKPGVENSLGTNTLGGQGRRWLETRSSRQEWATQEDLVTTKNFKISQVQWYISIALATQEAEHFGRQRQVVHLRSGDGDQPGQHGKTPSLLKMQNLS